MENLNFVDENATKGLMIINGQTINLFDLSPRQVSLPKMVKGLQGVIRFNGYSNWSVAQHSFLLSHIAERFSSNLANQYFTALEKGDVNKLPLFEKLLSGLGIDFTEIKKDLVKALKNRITIDQYISAICAYDALIHDFSEALTGDIIRPFKKLVPEIGEMEHKIDCQIRKIHNALPEMPFLVDILDKQLATIEAYYLTRVYGNTLLNENDDLHIRSFNSAFVASEESRLVSQLMLMDEINEFEVISDVNLSCFLRQSKLSINEIKEMSNENLLSLYVERAVSIKTAIEKLKATMEL